TFFKIDRTVWPRRGRPWRKDRCSPPLSYGADLNPISLIVNYCHCSRLRTWIDALCFGIVGRRTNTCCRALSSSSLIRISIFKLKASPDLGVCLAALWLASNYRVSSSPDMWFVQTFARRDRGGD